MGLGRGWFYNTVNDTLLEIPKEVEHDDWLRENYSSLGIDLGEVKGDIYKCLLLGFPNVLNLRQWADRRLIIVKTSVCNTLVTDALFRLSSLLGITQTYSYLIYDRDSIYRIPSTKLYEGMTDRIISSYREGEYATVYNYPNGFPMKD